MDALLPSHYEFIDSSTLKPLFEYMLTIPAISLKLRLMKVDDFEFFSSECKVFNFESKTLSCVNLIVSGGTVDIGDIHEFLCKPYTDAAPVLISMYKLAMTCGYASARVESLFSAMSYVDAPRRQRSKSERECALTHLFFERNLVKEITFEEFCEGWLKKTRSLLF